MKIFLDVLKKILFRPIRKIVRCFISVALDFTWFFRALTNFSSIKKVKIVDIGQTKIKSIAMKFLNISTETISNHRIQVKINVNTTDEFRWNFCLKFFVWDLIENPPILHANNWEFILIRSTVRCFIIVVRIINMKSFDVRID